MSEAGRFDLVSVYSRGFYQRLRERTGKFYFDDECRQSVVKLPQIIFGSKIVLYC
jgi:hypothetical protein